MRQLKGDNRGLSLLEVLIAMVVLSIVVVPFMHSFITAANTNAKAKRTHKATLVAQSVMEGFKAEPLEAIVEQFQNPAADFHILDPGRVRGSIADAVELVTDSARPGVYQFEIAGVREDVSAYDVLVTLDATAYRNAAITDKIQYNTTELVQLPVIDMNRDAVGIQKADYTDTAVGQLYNQLYPGPSENAIRTGMNREITVNIERTNMAGGDHRTRVVMQHKYTYGSAVYTITQTYFDSTETAEELRTVYLYYYPLYAAGVTRDVINYVNNSSLPVNFYLLKQDTGDVNVTTIENENAYRVQLNLKEPGSAEGAMRTKLYTNLGVNLVDGTVFTNLQGAREVKLNESSVALENISAPRLYESAAEDRLYDLQISVYEDGAKAAGFPENMRMMTMEGSRID